MSTSPPRKKMRLPSGLTVKVGELTFCVPRSSVADVPWFQAAANFGERSASVYTLRHDLVSPSSAAWKTVLGQLMDDNLLVVYDLNGLLQIYILYDFFYDGLGNHRHPREYLAFLRKNFPHWNAMDFTYAGLRDLLTLVPLVNLTDAEASPLQCGIDPSQNCKVRDTLFVAPPSTEALRDYIALRDVLLERKDYDLLIRHSVSLRHLPHPEGAFSVYSRPPNTTFHEYLNDKSQKQWDVIRPFLHPNRCVLAGGALVQAHRQNAPWSPCSDIDLWIFERDLMDRIVQHFEDSYDKVYYLTTSSVVTILVADCSCPIQLIFAGKEGTPWLSVHRFDLDYVRAYYDGQALQMLPEAMAAWEVNSVLRSTDTVGSVRLKKAEQKGFLIALTNHRVITESEERLHKYYYPRSNEPHAHELLMLRRVHPTWTVCDTAAEALEAFNGQPFGKSIGRYKRMEVTPQDLSWKMDQLTFGIEQPGKHRNFQHYSCRPTLRVEFKDIRLPFGCTDRFACTNRLENRRVSFNISKTSRTYDFLSGLVDSLIDSHSRKGCHNHAFTNRDSEFGPLFCPKLRLNSKFYDRFGSEIARDDVVPFLIPGVRVDMVVTIARMWIANGLGAGMCSDVESVKIYPPSSVSSQSCLGLLYTAEMGPL